LKNRGFSLRRGNEKACHIFHRPKIVEKNQTHAIVRGPLLTNLSTEIVRNSVSAWGRCVGRQPAGTPLLGGSMAHSQQNVHMPRFCARQIFP
jgi:hypothetical protein